MYEPYYSDKDCCTGGDCGSDGLGSSQCTDCCPSVCKTLHMYANSTICEDNSKELHWDDGVCKETDSFLIWYKVNIYFSLLYPSNILKNLLPLKFSPTQKNRMPKFNTALLPPSPKNKH